MNNEVYRKERAAGPFDAIVIGSGIGGLSVAALLAKAGRAVLVLERHYVAGGFTHTFRRNRYEWDVGVHYIGEVHQKGSLLRRLIDHLSEGNLHWAPIADPYDTAVFGDASYEFWSGAARFEEKFAEYFPAGREAVRRYLKVVDDCTDAARWYFMAKGLPPILDLLMGPVLRRRFLRFSDRTTWEVLSSLTRDPQLIGVLATQYGDYGLPPRQGSFAIHAMIAKHYRDGAAYPVGGAGQFARTIVPVIEKGGGKVLVSAAVERILTAEGKVRGVRLENGDEILAPQVISDAGVLNTYGRLLDPGDQAFYRLDRRPQAIRPSLAHVCLYIGLKKSADELRLPQTNYWVYPGYDHDENMRRYLENPSAPMPVAFISFPSAKDPEWEKSHPGMATIEAVGAAPYEWFERWEDKPWRRRGPDYEALKESFSKRLLEEVFRRVPQIRGHVDHAELSTPLSTRHFANYSRGEIYGLEHTPERFRQNWLRPRTPIKGLYLTGQDIVTDGIGGALFGGVLAASVILRKNLIGEILRS